MRQANMLDFFWIGATFCEPLDGVLRNDRIEYPHTLLNCRVSFSSNILSDAEIDDEFLARTRVLQDKT